MYLFVCYCYWMIKDQIKINNERKRNDPYLLLILTKITWLVIFSWLVYFDYNFNNFMCLIGTFIILYEFSSKLWKFKFKFEYQ